MAILTLTTDFSDQDHYIGAVKGKILNTLPQATIVDISHHIEPFNIMQGAFVLKNCYYEFPPGTIHLVSVDASHGSHQNEVLRYLVVHQDQHYFIGTDNGLFSLLFDEKPEELYKIDAPQEGLPSFPLKNVFVDAGLHLAQEKSIDEIASPVEELIEKRPLQPIVRDNFIQGSVIHIDAYKNAVVNIEQSLFEKVGQARPYRIYYARKDNIEQVAENYNEVPEGEVLCLFGSSGYLEIALNKAPAANLLGLEIGDPIQVEFLS